MLFEPSESQRLVRDTVSRFARDHAGHDLATAQAWAQLADVGLAALTLPEEAGGLAGEGVDIVLAMEALGYELVFAPVPEFAIFGATLATSEGGEIAGGRLRLLPAVLGGGALATYSGGTGAEVRLSAQLSVGYGFAAATHMVVRATHGPDDEDKAFSVALDGPGVTATPVHLLDGSEGARVDLRDAPAQLVGGAPAWDRSIDLATLAVCAESVGIMRRLLDATGEHLRTRRQFGVLLGSFQALQHRFVDAHLAMELAAMSVWDAGLSNAAAMQVCAARVQVAEAAKLVTREAIQMHGAMGMTEELAIGRGVRRLEVNDRRYGHVAGHLDRYLSSMDQDDGKMTAL